HAPPGIATRPRNGVRMTSTNARLFSPRQRWRRASRRLCSRLRGVRGIGAGVRTHPGLQSQTAKLCTTNRVADRVEGANMGGSMISHCVMRHLLLVFVAICLNFYPFSPHSY